MAANPEQMLYEVTANTNQTFPTAASRLRGKTRVDFYYAAGSDRGWDAFLAYRHRSSKPHLQNTMVMTVDRPTSQRGNQLFPQSSSQTHAMCRTK